MDSPSGFLAAPEPLRSKELPATLAEKSEYCIQPSKVNQVFIPIPVPLPPGVTAVFSSRRGGVSPPPWETLNCAAHVGDHPQNVQENRRMLGAALGCPTEHWQLLEQVHGVEVWPATSPCPVPPPRADALVTSIPGRLLGIFTADCAPVLFWNEAGTVVGAAHAGWRGAVAGILQNTVGALQRQGAAPERLWGCIGPLIRPSHYQVDAAFFAAVTRALGNDAKDLFTPDPASSEHWRFDLPGLVRRQLIAAGLAAEHIVDLGRCTCAEPEAFFSHRRTTLEGGTVTGRQFSAIFLRGS
ncbi:MAG: peptidoglycan editing factor PgeF [Magnetococcus sp. WYHC-3]